MGDSRLVEVAVEAARQGGEVLLRHYGQSNLRVEEKEKNDFVSRADRESEAAVIASIRDAFPDHHILAEEGGRQAGLAGEDYEWIVDPLDGTTNYLQGVPFFCVSIACRRRGEMVAAAILDPLRDDLFTAAAGAGAYRNGERLRLVPENGSSSRSPAQPHRGTPRPPEDSDGLLGSRDGLDGAFLATGFPFKARGGIDLYVALFRDIFLEARGIRRCGAAALDLAYTAAGVFDGFFEFRLAPWDIAAGSLLVQEAGGAVSDLDGGQEYLERGNILAGATGVHRRLLEIVSRHTSEADLNRLVPR